MQSCTRQPFVKRDKCSSGDFLGHWANSCFSCSCFAIWTGAIHHIRLEISWARHYSIEVKCENQRQAFRKYRAGDWNWESYRFGLCGCASSVHAPDGLFDILRFPKGRTPAFSCSHFTSWCIHPFVSNCVSSLHTSPLKALWWLHWVKVNQVRFKIFS